MKNLIIIAAFLFCYSCGNKAPEERAPVEMVSSKGEKAEILNPNVDKIEIVKVQPIEATVEAEEQAEYYTAYLNVVSLSSADISKGLLENIELFNSDVVGFQVALLDSIYETPEERVLFNDFNDDWYGPKLIFRNLKKYTIKGAINVFVMESKDLYEFYTDDVKESLNLGMTPVPKQLGICKSWSPDLDYIFVSDQGIIHGETLKHELGHYYGLGHVFQHTREELKSIGVSSINDFLLNTMNYTECPTVFTEEQKQVMKYVALKYRNYHFEFID